MPLNRFALVLLNLFPTTDKLAIVADELYSQYACIECTSERAKVKFIVKLITVKYKTMVYCRHRKQRLAFRAV